MLIQWIYCRQNLQIFTLCFNFSCKDDSLPKKLNHTLEPPPRVPNKLHFLSNKNKMTLHQIFHVHCGPSHPPLGSLSLFRSTVCQHCAWQYCSQLIRSSVVNKPKIMTVIPSDKQAAVVLFRSCLVKQAVMERMPLKNGADTVIDYLSHLHDKQDKSLVENPARCWLRGPERRPLWQHRGRLPILTFTLAFNDTVGLILLRFIALSPPDVVFR